MKKSRSYKDYLFDRLKDPEEAAAYLNAALEDEELGVFLLALRDIAKANGGMTQLAKEAHVNRESLYRTVSKKGNPSISQLRLLLNTLGLEISVHPSHR